MLTCAEETSTPFGYHSDASRLIRDGLPRPGGCLVVIVFGIFSSAILGGLVILQ